MQRVLVVGPCGAGKSTLALQLGRITGLPVFHMDRLHWSAGWVEGTRDELVAKLTPILAQPQWIIDGNYGGTMPLRLQHADTAIALDYPRRIYLRRVMQRMLLARWTHRPDMADGCHERFAPEFLRYVWRFHADARPRMLDHLDARPHHVTLVTLHHPRDTRRYLTQLRSG